VSAHVVIDQLATISAEAFASTAPARLIDTRGGEPVDANGQRCFAADGDPFDLAVVNVTPVQAQGRGYGRIDSSDRRAVGPFSNVNFDVGSIDPNLAVASIGADGKLCFTTSATVHVVVDQVAVIRCGDRIALARASPRHSGDDVRPAVGLTLLRRRRGAPSDLATVNVTPVRATGRGFGFVSSSVQDGSDISNVNFDVGTIDPNTAVVTVGDGRACFHNSATATVDVVIDSLVTLDAAAMGDATSRRLIDSHVGSPVTFDLSAVFGNVDPAAAAVDVDGTVVAAAGNGVLVRHWDGVIESIGLPAGVDVSHAWVGTDTIAVVWGSTNGVEIDLGRAELASTLSTSAGTWTRTLAEADRYAVNPSRPSGPLDLGLLTLPSTSLPTVEGAGCSEVLSSDDESWTVPRPANCSARVDKIAPVPGGGFVTTLLPPDTETQIAYPYLLVPGGTIVALATVDLTTSAIDAQPGPDGVTTLLVQDDTATIGFIPPR
jgi:hypothetical protein